MVALKRVLTLMRRYPSVVVSVLILLTLVGVSIYTVITIHLSEALVVWNAHNHERNEIPRSALPVWTNLFRRENLPESIFVPTDDFESTTEQINETVRRVTTLLTFDYDYTAFPSEMIFLYKINYGTKRPILNMAWIKPDGSESAAFNGIPTTGNARLALDPSECLGESGEDKAQKGEYTLRIQITAFSEEEVSLDGKLIVFGRVYGLGGTDYMRRDLGIGLLWGTPIALLFGLLAATGTAMLGFGIAAIGSWLGGWVDAAIQRATEVSMMIPFLPTILIVAFLYSSSIWVLLAFIVGLNIFSGQLKSYRAMFLQMMNAEYIEAARVYGASNTRIIFRYLIPHAFPAVLPRLILGIPLFVFLEASLAMLGVSDPNVLTWGKMLSEARGPMYMGQYFMILQPAFLLLLTGLSFSMLGYTLDRIFNPRLRSS